MKNYLSMNVYEAAKLRINQVFDAIFLEQRTVALLSALPGME